MLVGLIATNPASRYLFRAGNSTQHERRSETGKGEDLITHPITMTSLPAA
jgi:hypothetical protein